jgi:DNA-binding PucR family transcriptional regulator
MKRLEALSSRPAAAGQADHHQPGGVANVEIGRQHVSREFWADADADADAALGWAHPSRLTVYFAHDWLAVSLSRQATRLAPLFTRAAATAQADVHLAEAVLAFADNGLSLAGAARALHLHPNSLSYRLDRWRERSGWDPRTGDGLVASLVALRL